MEKRIFVPLARDPFEDFRDRGKIAEIRKYGRGWTEKHIREDRPVELRLGYNGKESIYGEVGQVVVGPLVKAFDVFGIEQLLPRFDDLDTAMTYCSELMGDIEQTIVFEVKNRLHEVRY